MNMSQQNQESNSGLVYCIQAVNGGPIKIGASENPDKRLKELQTGHPHSLAIIGTFPGGYRLEGQLHRYFADERTYGEWFDVSLPEIEAVIEHLSTEYHRSESATESHTSLSGLMYDQYHPLAPSALTQASRLANLFCPVTPAQTKAHKRLTKAIAARDLVETVRAIQAMKTTGTRQQPMATPEWAEWADSWLEKVGRLIAKRKTHETQ